MSSEFVSGDTRTKLVQLEINGNPFVIDQSSVVKAQLVSKDKMKVLTSAPAICASDMTGAAWATSLVAVKLPREATSAIKTFGAALLEIQITEDPFGEPEDFTFYIPVTVTKGNLA